MPLDRSKAYNCSRCKKKEVPGALMGDRYRCKECKRELYKQRYAIESKRHDMIRKNTEYNKNVKYPKQMEERAIKLLEKLKETNPDSLSRIQQLLASSSDSE